MRAITEIYPSFNPALKSLLSHHNTLGNIFFLKKVTKWWNWTHRTTVKMRKSIWCGHSDLGKQAWITCPIVLIQVEIALNWQTPDTKRRECGDLPLQWSGMCIWPISPFHVSPQLSHKTPPPSQHTYEQKRMGRWQAGVNELNSPWHPSDPCTHPT